MCDVKEAERHEQLGEIYENEKNKPQAIEHYLEATAIYVLNLELLKDESLLNKANKCYQKVQSLRGEKPQNFSKQELAQLTVKELNFTQNNHNHHEHETNSHIRHFTTSKINDTTLSEIEVLL